MVCPGEKPPYGEEIVIFVFVPGLSTSSCEKGELSHAFSAPAPHALPRPFSPLSPDDEELDFTGDSHDIDSSFIVSRTNVFILSEILASDPKEYLPDGFRRCSSSHDPF